MSRASAGPRLSALVAGLVALTFTACGGSSPGTGGQARDLNIGVLVDLTGPYAETGQMQQLGAQLAVDEINKSGGIKSLGGARLKLVVRDTGTQVSDAVNAMQSLLASNDLVAGIGTGISSQTIAISEVGEQHRIPWIDVAFDDKITERGFKFIFAVSPKQSTLSDVEFPGLQQIAKEAGINLTRVGIIHSTNVTDVAAVNAVVKTYAPRYGWNIVMNQVVQAGTVSGGLLSTIVGQIKDKDPQVLMIGSSVADVVAINRQLLAEGLKPKPWVLNGAPYLSKSFLDALGPQGTQGIMTVASAGNYATNRAIANKIAAAGQVPQEYNLVAYSEIYMIAQALEKAKSTDHQKVRDAIASLDIHGGPAGSVWPCNCERFDSTGRSATATALIEQWQNGRPETILPTRIASAKPYWPQ